MDFSRLARLSVISLGPVAAFLAIDAQSQEADQTLPLVTVTAAHYPDAPVGAMGADEAALASRRAGASDTTRLLEDAMGIDAYAAGGVSALPAIHGLADDRIRVQVDGMDLMPACPNHMNSALSYIDPSRVGTATVFAGITPASLGGDSIGGSIQVGSAPPQFAETGTGTLVHFRSGTYFRSNGNAWGANVGASYASETLSISLDGAGGRSEDYRAGASFKPAGFATLDGNWISGEQVGSSSYTALNDGASLAWRVERQLLRFDFGVQHIPYEGFPNQRMDMTSNLSGQGAVTLQGDYDWGTLETRVFWQQTWHTMNMGRDRFSYGRAGMPMDTRAKNGGALVHANIRFDGTDLLRLGGEIYAYQLNDWWPAAGGSMGPLAFWNVDNGRRDRVDMFGEWEGRWASRGVWLLGARADRVTTDAGPVEGYSGSAMWATDAGAFDAADRRHIDMNWNLTALARFPIAEEDRIEAGLARLSRSPNLYQRYAWSTQPMATLMNNFVGDGNGYVGNLGLKPEVADTASFSAKWGDAEDARATLDTSIYFTRIHDEIDAKRCDIGECGGVANLQAAGAFVNLQYVNQEAQLYGVDLSGHAALVETGRLGTWSVRGKAAFVRGMNLTTGDSLYHIMPLNGKIALEQAIAGWTNAVEMQAVEAKIRVSEVRNEAPTPGYGLLNLRSDFLRRAGLNKVRLDLAIENVLNRGYALPLGGAYIGQGATMAVTGAPWGITVPGPGRSFNVALGIER